MGDRLFELAFQIPTVALTFVFCGWLVKLVFDRLMSMTIERIVEQFKLAADRQHDQMERLISLFREHVRGEP